MTANPHIFFKQLTTYLQIYRLQVTQHFVSITTRKLRERCRTCRSICCEISCAAWRFIICAHEFSLAERNFEEKSAFVQANYCSIRCEISCELSSKFSSKNHGNKERNLHISLALLLHNTVTKFLLVLPFEGFQLMTKQVTNSFFILKLYT